MARPAFSAARLGGGRARRPRRRRASRRGRARHCFSGALAVTALAVVDEVVGERRARERAWP
jgi:hypothetical protein